MFKLLISTLVVYNCLVWSGCGGGGGGTSKRGRFALKSDVDGYNSIKGVKFFDLIHENRGKKFFCYSVQDYDLFSYLIRFDVPETIKVELSRLADGLQSGEDGVTLFKPRFIYQYASGVEENNNKNLIFVVKSNSDGCFRVALVVKHGGGVSKRKDSSLQQKPPVEQGYDWVKDVKHVYFPREKLSLDKFTQLEHKYNIKAFDQYIRSASAHAIPNVYLEFELERCPGRSADAFSALIRFNLDENTHLQ